MVCECARCGARWEMLDHDDIGKANVCPMCTADDWDKPHHYE